MEYLGFDLRLGDWNPETHTGEAEVLYSPAGEGRRYRFLLQLDIEATAQRIHRTPDEAEELGRQLFQSIFTEPSLSLWRESYQIARERRRGLRLRLHIGSWNLGRVPWELLYDPRQREFLVFDPQVSLARYIRMGASPPVLRQAGKLKVMVVVASPTDLVQLDCDCEVAMLREALQELIDSGQAELIVCAHATHEMLHAALLDHRPDVVHFVGHGEYNQQERAGYLILEDARGLSHRLNASEAARILRRYGTNLVVLNACETATGAWAGLAPALVRAEIAAVVAMQWPVEDRAAIRFSHSFYRALAQGKSVDECMAEGRLGASAASDDPNDWTAPVLFLRSVSGQLWTQDVQGARTGADASARIPTTPPPPPARRGSGLSPLPETLFRTRGPLQPVSDGALVIDRPALQRALRIARQPSVTQYIALLSARQTGKTTLLLRFKELLQDYSACIFVDLSVLSAQDTSACFGYVAFRLLSELRELLGDELPMLETGQTASSVGFIEFLRELAGTVAAPRIIVLVDEVGALAPEVSNSFFNTLRTVFTEGRGLNNSLAKYLFVFSGAVDLYTLTSGNNSPLNICEKIYLEDFDMIDVRRIVEQFGRLDISVEEGVVERVYYYAAGHPYLTMRLCSLVERQLPDSVSVEMVDKAAEAMLVEDDNIRHVIRELEARPAERRRLRPIVMDGESVLFSRNDPILASLEMIGVIQPVQPIQVRNRLYERALREMYVRTLEPERIPLIRGSGSESAVESETVYERLAILRSQALTPEGYYAGGTAWESFAAALLATVPAFSLFPAVTRQVRAPELLVSIKRHGNGHWDIYHPGVLFTFAHLPDVDLPALLEDLAVTAQRQHVRLVLVLATGWPEGREGGLDAPHRQPDDVTVVFLDDAELGRLIADGGDVDAWLHEKVLEVRLNGG